MLELIIPAQKGELFDEEKEEFIYFNTEESKLKLEHSLLSLKKWEQKYHKPFLIDDNKTPEEMIYYIKCMTINISLVDPDVFNHIPSEFLLKIKTYLKDPMSATTINNKVLNTGKGSKEIITAEIIYYWMITLNIPIEFEKWNLNQLITLINVVVIKNGGNKNKKNSRQAAIERNAENLRRRTLYNSKG